MEQSIKNNSEVPPVNTTISKNEYVELVRQVEEVYVSIGARVIHGISYTGEDSVSLYVPDEKVTYINNLDYMSA